jgi:hypothetical protein
MAARQRMIGGLAPPLPRPAGAVTGPFPAGLVLEPGEQALWTGSTVCAPWWFGGQDMYLSAFGLVWLACTSLLGVLTVTNGSGAFLIFLVPMAVACGLYPAIGRLIHRRMRIRSAYVVTSRRLITSWRLGGEPVTVQAQLGQLLPPAVRWQTIFTDQATSRERGSSAGWKNLLWPASTTTPPVLIGITDPHAVREPIAAVQLALRAAPAAERTLGLATPDPQ